MMITSQASERLVWCDFIGGESEGSLRLVRFLLNSFICAAIFSRARLVDALPSTASQDRRWPRQARKRNANAHVGNEPNVS